MKIKKILILFSLVSVALLIFYFMYRMFFGSIVDTKKEEKVDSQEVVKNRLPESKTGGQNRVDVKKEDQFEKEDLKKDEEIIQKKSDEIESNIDNVAKGGITKVHKITDDRTLEPTLDENGQSVRYYNRDDGFFYRINKNGQKTVISDKKFYNADKVSWSNKGNKAVIYYPDDSKIIYNFQTQKQNTLPKHWKDFDFSPDGNQLVMKSIGVDVENRWVIVSNEDGSRTRSIKNIRKYDDNVYPSWSPNNQIAALYSFGTDANNQDVYFLGFNDENFRSMSVSGRDFRHKWTPKGDKLLYSVYDQNDKMKPKLWLVGAQGDNIGQGKKDLYLNTWVDKCTFSNNDEVYCAVPKDLPEYAGLFPELSEKTYDELYKVNLKTGQKQKIAIPETTFNINKLMINETKNDLYFTDKFNGKLYRIRLK